ncbi:MAG: ribosome maturation factor RimP [Clostridiales bacterium]|nr:ribosome maturation factor RimP [Clostridiales bacterium]
MKTTEICEKLVQGTVEALGYELRDVEFVREHGGWVLTLFIDKTGGVTIDDCEAVSRAVEPILDEADPIAQPYFLSVSSPGLDRPLKKPADFTRNLGKEVTVKLYAPRDKKKELAGELTASDEDSLTLRLADGSDCVITKKDAALVKPYIKF